VDRNGGQERMRTMTRAMPSILALPTPRFLLSILFFVNIPFATPRTRPLRGVLIKQPLELTVSIRINIPCCSSTLVIFELDCWKKGACVTE
jgi:hypothetical protein